MKRYSIEGCDDGGIDVQDWPLGEWVKYSDYQDLEAKLEAAEKEATKFKSFHEQSKLQASRLQDGLEKMQAWTDEKEQSFAVKDKIKSLETQLASQAKMMEVLRGVLKKIANDSHECFTGLHPQQEVDEIRAIAEAELEKLRGKEG